SISSNQSMDSRDDEPHNRIIYSLPCRLGVVERGISPSGGEKLYYGLQKAPLPITHTEDKEDVQERSQACHSSRGDPYILFGQNYQIVTSDITADGGYGGLYLSGVISERDIDAVQHFRHGCTLSASPLKEPCVRNTFKITGCGSDKAGQPVPSGEDVFLEICETDERPLYIQCENLTTDTFGGHLSLRLSQSPDIYCRFKLFSWNPQRRYETIGTNFPPNTRIIIQHTASGRNLAVEQNKWVPSFYGPECIVSCHTYKNCHKMETAENFWKIVSRPIPNTALYIRAAKGEDIPSELFD
ncbi:hypothetical protein NQ318_007015, partial [Aromia moschata]